MTLTKRRSSNQQFSCFRERYQTNFLKYSQSTSTARKLTESSQKYPRDSSIRTTEIINFDSNIVSRHKADDLFDAWLVRWKCPEYFQIERRSTIDSYFGCRRVVRFSFFGREQVESSSWRRVGERRRSVGEAWICETIAWNVRHSGAKSRHLLVPGLDWWTLSLATRYRLLTIE